jgi:outer membrane receptor protein involved in Fe transport
VIAQFSRPPLPNNLRTPNRIYVSRDGPLGLNVSALSSSYFRGDESDLNRKLTIYDLIDLTTKYQVTERPEIFGSITNLTNSRYAAFGAFADTGAVQPWHSRSTARAETEAAPALRLLFCRVGMRGMTRCSGVR